MTYLYVYMGIGAVVLVFTLCEHLLIRGKQSDFVRDALDAIDPARKTLLRRALVDVVVPALAALLVFVIWPAAVYLKVKEWRGKDKATEPELDREFAVMREHLLERLTQAEIEQRERVFDPLGAVPDLPFGHLHAAWQGFLSDRPEGAELWSFSAPWGDRRRRESLTGYVLVRDGVPGAWFTVIKKPVPQNHIDR